MFGAYKEYGFGKPVIARQIKTCKLTVTCSANIGVDGSKEALHVNGPIRARSFEVGSSALDIPPVVITNSPLLYTATLAPNSSDTVGAVRFTFSGDTSYAGAAIYLGRSAYVNGSVVVSISQIDNPGVVAQIAASITSIDNVGIIHLQIFSNFMKLSNMEVSYIYIPSFGA